MDYGFPQRPKSQEKNLNNLRTKRAFAVKKKTHFLSFLKGFQLPKIVSRLRLRLDGLMTLASSRPKFNCSKSAMETSD